MEALLLLWRRLRRPLSTLRTFVKLSQYYTGADGSNDPHDHHNHHHDAMDNQIKLGASPDAPTVALRITPRTIVLSRSCPSTSALVTSAANRDT